MKKILGIVAGIVGIISVIVGVALNNCLPHSRYFSDELGGQIFAKLSN